MSAKKIVLITGSTRGLGLKYAERLAQKNYTVALHDISGGACSVYHEEESVESLLKRMKGYGSDSRFYAADLTKEAGANELVQSVMKDYGRIDALINNVGGDISGHDNDAAGGKPSDNTLLAKTDDFFSIYDRNFLSCLYMCRAIAPVMQKQGIGKILNVASISAGFGVSKESAYAIAKAGVVHLTRCLATELRPWGINVNCIAPSGTRTGRFLATLKDRTPEDLSRFEAKGRLERLAEPEDIAKVVEFFLSDLSDFVSGQVLRIDGAQFTTPL